MRKILLILALLLTGVTAWAQKPGTTPVKVSDEKQMMHGRKYYVHIVEKGQTVYSIARAYRVESFDAVTHVDIHSLHPGDTVWIPFRGQFAEDEDPSTSAPAPTPAPATVRVDTVHVHDTTYINVPYAVHDTTIVTNTVTVTEQVPVHDTSYIHVHDTTIVTNTVTVTEQVPVHDTTYITVYDTTFVNVPYAVHDTTYINVPYTVHDTTIVTNTVTEQVPVHDTSYIHVHDTTIVTNTVTVTEQVPVHDTTYITIYDTAFVNVPYAVHDTIIVTNTVTETEQVPVHDTTYITVYDTTLVNVPYAVHDTTYINVPYTVHDTTIITNTVTVTEYVQVHDTTYINVHDTTYTTVSDTVTLTKYKPVHDTTYLTVHDTIYFTVHDTTYFGTPYAVHDTTIIIDTVTLTEYVTVHDTTYINVPYAVRDTSVITDTVTLTEYVTVHDTTYVNVPYTVRDTSVITDTVTLTEYVTVHDTTYINVPYAVHDTSIIIDTVTLTEYVTVHDTTYINVPYAVRDTSVIIDTVTLTNYKHVHDTTYITMHDTIYINSSYTVHDTTIVIDTVTLTKYVPVHDTTYINLHDTTYINVPYTVHDTTFIIDTVNYASVSSPALAFASTSAVAMTEYVPNSQPFTSPSNPTTEEPRRQARKTLKIALMMPLHLDQMEQISTSKFDIEQRGKKSYRQFEFIEFYEGILMALDRLAEEGINIELNVVDVSENSATQVEQAFMSHKVAQSDFIVALLLRDAFDRAAALAQQAGVYIVNPMATRSELCAENPYMVKIQPSVEGMISLMLNNMVAERPKAHLYVIHSGSKEERPVFDELKRQLESRTDIAYTLFNWSQSAKLTALLNKTPSCNVLSIYDQNKDNNRVFAGNLLNKLAAFKTNTPSLYTLNDWTRDYVDVDFAQLQQLNYHTFSTAWDMTNEVHINFLKAYRTRFGTEPTSALASTGYDLMLYLAQGLNQKNSDFWLTPGNTLPSLTQPLHLRRHGAGLENDRAQLYRLENLHFIKATAKTN